MPKSAESCSIGLRRPVYRGNGSCFGDGRDWPRRELVPGANKVTRLRINELVRVPDPKAISASSRIASGSPSDTRSSLGRVDSATVGRVGRRFPRTRSRARAESPGCQVRRRLS